MTTKKQSEFKMSKKSSVNLRVPREPSYVLYFILLIVLIIAISNTIAPTRVTKSKLCSNRLKWDVDTQSLKLVSRTKVIKESDCYSFKGKTGEIVTIDTNVNIILLTPEDQRLMSGKGSSKNILSETGTYLLVVDGKNNSTSNYQIKIKLKPQNTLPNNAVDHTSISNNKNELKFHYNVSNYPPFFLEKKLQKIINESLDLIQHRDLSINNLSISLVKLSEHRCCAYASYADDKPVFPASISKLFWVVALYAQYKEGILPEITISEKDIYKMIQDSDNEAASHVLDAITGTESGYNLASNELNIWINQRQSINRFFQSAGYKNVNVSQKNFPIPYLKLEQPKGRDLQIRGNSSNPIRNYVTSYEVARLLYEIYTRQAVSKEYSEKIESFLKKDLNPAIWKKDEYNTIEGFLAESLPRDTYIASKVGWTSESRQDAAIIVSPDGKTRYILVILADNPGFSNDWKIFPQISRQVYERMLEYK